MKLIERLQLDPRRIIGLSLCIVFACVGSRAHRTTQPAAASSANGLLSAPIPGTTADPPSPSSETPMREIDAGPPALAETGAEPLPEGFVAAGENGTMDCSGYHIESPTEPNSSAITFVRATTSSGKHVYEAHGRYLPNANASWRQSLWAVFCGDLTGDGIPELAMTESSGGAHCCYTHYVVSLSTPPKRLLMWEKGDANTPLVPVKLRAGAGWQLEASVVIWPPFDSDREEPLLCYATAPVVPAFLSLEGGTYALTSLSFPDAYRKHRQEQRANCANGKECDVTETAIYAWIDSLAIGDWDMERTQVTDVKLRAVLARHAATMRKILERELGSLRAPAALNAH